MKLHFLDANEVQLAMASYLRKRREAARLTRAALAQRSLVPSPTIKKFETSGQISLRQLLLLWQSLDDLQRLFDLTRTDIKAMPQSIEEVLRDEL